MYLLIVFLPLLGSSVAGFFGRFLGSEGTAIMTTTCVSFEFGLGRTRQVMMKHEHVCLIIYTIFDNILWFFN
jgi:NADH:ubiquinone oxidoreductase subunit 5 (subunit L)/multisubunit Na+/H+ antiporter MnhA subunit